MNKNKKLLVQLKTNSYKLRVQGSLPFQLVYYISQLDESSPIDWINYLKQQCEHMLRIKGYYNRYTDIEKQFDEVIKKDYERRFN